MTTIDKIGKYTPALVIAFSALVFCFMGFYNHFPLLYPDSGTYIASGFENWMPDDRPIIYGLFIRHISMHESLWFVVYAQGLILSYILYKLFAGYFQGKQLLSVMLIFAFTTTLFTGISVNVCQLIADVFTPVCIIIMTLFLTKEKEMSKTESAILFLLGVFAIGTHNSHSIICFAILISWIFWQFVVVRNKARIKQIIRRVCVVAAMLVSGFFLNNLASLALGHGFYPGSAGPVFLMSRLTEEGILDAYLNEKCGEKNYRICAYKDNIPTDFLWDFDHSPLYKTGGWQANKKEYQAIVVDILTTPKYLKKFLIKMIEYTGVQLFSFTTGDTPPLQKGTPAYEVIRVHFPDYFRLYQLSLQYNSQLNYDFVNQAQKIFIMLSVLALVLYFIVFSSTIPLEFKSLCFILSLGIILNALVCSAFSTIVPRYESRVIWLIAIPPFIIAAKSKWAQNFFNKREE